MDLLAGGSPFLLLILQQLLFLSNMVSGRGSSVELCTGCVQGRKEGMNKEITILPRVRGLVGYDAMEDLREPTKGCTS